MVLPLPRSFVMIRAKFTGGEQEADARHGGEIEAKLYVSRRMIGNISHDRT